MVRGFATYLHTIDPTTEVPAADLLQARPRRATMKMMPNAVYGAHPGRSIRSVFVAFFSISQSMKRPFSSLQVSTSSQRSGSISSMWPVSFCGPAPGGPTGPIG